jgi:heat shock protein HtpX
MSRNFHVDNLSENNLKTRELAETRCPECGKMVPQEAGHVVWCECGWNLKPLQVKESGNLLHRLYDGLGRKRGRAVFNELVKSSDLRPGVSIPMGLLFLAAAFIQLFTVALLLFGIYLILANYTNYLLIILGLSLIVFAVTGRPRLGKVPANCLAPDKFTGLHLTINRIAALLKTSPPQCIVIDSHFNAEVTRRGLRQKKVLHLGLPLLLVLNGQEKVALIAHELAHFANGDLTRGVFVSITLNTLEKWHHLLARDYFWPRRAAGKSRYGSRSGGLTGGIANLAEFLTNVLVHLLSFVPYLFLWVLTRLAWDGQQRAEYLADQLGARVSGTDAFVSMSEKMLFSSRVRLTAQRVVLKAHSRDVIAELQEEFSHIPPREFERLRRLAEMQETSLNATHPPTALRIRLLKAMKFREPQLVLSEKDDAALTNELSVLKQAVNQRLIDEYRRSLYR